MDQRKSAKILERTKVILQPKDYIGFKLLEEMGLPTEVLPKLILPNEIVGEVTKSGKSNRTSEGYTCNSRQWRRYDQRCRLWSLKLGRAHNKTATASDLVVCADHPNVDPKSRVVSYAHVLPTKCLLIGGYWR